MLPSMVQLPSHPFSYVVHVTVKFFNNMWQFKVIFLSDSIFSFMHFPQVCICSSF